MVVLKCVRKPLVRNFVGSSEAVVQTTTTLSCSRPGHLHLATLSRAGGGDTRSDLPYCEMLAMPRDPTA